jgi:Peptidase inhibitor I9
MIGRMLLCYLALVALLIDYIDVVRAEEGGVPVIVVFQPHATFDNFRGVYQADERERQHPGGWRYLKRDVLGAVQTFEAALGFRADHVYSAALRGFAARLTSQQMSILAHHTLAAYVEPYGIMRTQAQEMRWGIDRIDADLSSIQAGTVRV